MWLNNQHRKAKQGQLNARQLQKLGEIGFFENAPGDRSWENNYLEAKRYYEAVGNVEIPHDYLSEDGFWMGRWIQKQRRRLRRCALTAEQIKRLDAIGMRWEDPRKTRWYVCLEAFCEYPRKATGVPIVPADVRSEFGTVLKNWVQHREDNYKKGRLDATQRTCWEEMIREAASLSVSHEVASRKHTAAVTL